MDAKLKAKWVKALCSGEYKQAQYELYDSGGYCCLGVLGAVHGLSRDAMEGEGLLNNVLGPDVILDNAIQVELTNLNDTVGDTVELPCGDFLLDEGVPFEMIAGLIDEAL